MFDERIYIGTVNLYDPIYRNEDDLVSYKRSNIYAIKSNTESFLVETDDKLYKGLILLYEHDFYNNIPEYNGVSEEQLIVLGDWLSAKDCFNPDISRWDILEEAHRKINNISDDIPKKAMPNYREYVPCEIEFDDNDTIRVYEKRHTELFSRPYNCSFYKDIKTNKQIEATKWNGTNISEILTLLSNNMALYVYEIPNKQYMGNKISIHISKLFNKEKIISGELGYYIIREGKSKVYYNYDYHIRKGNGKIYFMKPEEFESKFKKI